jgi:hypothetical protein
MKIRIENQRKNISFTEKRESRTKETKIIFRSVVYTEKGFDLIVKYRNRRLYVSFVSRQLFFNYQ